MHVEVPGVRTTYNGVALGQDGTIYVAGTRGTYTLDQWSDPRVMLRAFDPGGAPLWAVDVPAPGTARIAVSDIVRTTDDTLVVAAARYGPGGTLPELALAAFDTAGGPVWWHEWDPGAIAAPLTGPLAATPDGGVFLAGADWDQGWGPPTGTCWAARFDASGANVWQQHFDGGRALDVLLAPDGLLYVLTRWSITPLVP